MNHRIFWLLVALGMLIFCGIIPLPGETTGLPVGMSLFLFTMIGWPLFIGPRLHKPKWQKLAEQRRTVKSSRPTRIELKGSRLIFREQRGHYSGVEANVDHLSLLIEAMYDLARAVKGS